MGQEKEFRLANQAHIAMSYINGQNDAPVEDFSMLVRQISIDKLQEEPKKLGPNFKNSTNIQKNPHENLCGMFLKSLLKPKDYQLQAPGSKFPFKREDIIELAGECANILAAQPTVIKDIKPPVKVFGNIFGNYVDLMRFFDIWKMPHDNSDKGDIAGFDYLFLGNYVDRGAYNLETICLLMALKLKHPKQIFLLRGNHEDRNVNKYLGFGEECAKRLGEDITNPNSAFAKINDMFDQLPLAGIIYDKKTQNKVFCVHGGIGSTAMKIEEIEKIKRPCEIGLGEIQNQDQQLVIDLLWSDPTDKEEDGMQPNLDRDPQGQNNIMKFGIDRVQKFLNANSLSMILRSHQICPDGLDRFAQGQLITISSCTNYCNKYNNDACFIVVQKSIIISPKIIKPNPASSQNWVEISLIPETANSSVRRPITPPRERQVAQSQ